MENSPRSLNRQIISLAVPALGALAAEPLFLLADSAMVGHLGTAQLGGLTVGTTIMGLLVGLCIFLAYTTTAVAARRLGAGDQQGALRAGIDGMWLAGLIGVILAVLLAAFAPLAVGLFNSDSEVTAFAVTYVRWSAPGLVGMLVVLAATGTLRGLLDTKTPFWVASTGAVANVIFNATLIYGLGLGVAGSAIGTSLTQTLMAVALALKVVVGARGLGVSLSPQGSGLWDSARAGAPLIVRTATMHFAFIAAVYVATNMGQAELAGYQIVKTMWMLLANVLDALAIAAQALVGHALGEGDRLRVREVMGRCLRWGFGAGIILGLVLAAGAPLWPRIFSPDPAVWQVTFWALVVAGICQPLAGIVFMYDGVLIGANDGNYLAAAATINLLVLLPFFALIYYFGEAGPSGLAWLWAAYGLVYFGMRFLTLWWRARTDVWMKLA